MKTIFQLRDAAQNIFQDGKPTISKLIYAWSQLEDNDLPEILDKASINIYDWTKALIKTIETENSYKTGNLSDTISFQCNFNSSGIKLLFKLCMQAKKPEYKELKKHNMLVTATNSKDL